MAQIKLFRPETYPDTVNKVREKLQAFPENFKSELRATEFLCDYISSVMWDVQAPFGKLHQDLMCALEPHEIVAYHNTRLPDKTSIENHGLIFSDDRYIDMLQSSLQAANIEQLLIDEVIGVVVHERDRWKSGDLNMRKNEVCYIYDMDYYKNYEEFLAVYGGEFMEFGLSAHTKNQSLLKYKNIIKIGHPYVVEFAIPFNWMKQFNKVDIARYMMEEWIHLDIKKDKVAHQYDGRIEHEIPADKIIEVREVEDSFPEIDRWLFRQN